LKQLKKDKYLPLGDTNLYLQANVSLTSTPKAGKFATKIVVNWIYENSMWHFKYGDDSAFPFEDETIVKIDREIWVSEVKWEDGALCYLVQLEKEGN
jgi:hypothetical protein